MTYLLRSSYTLFFLLFHFLYIPEISAQISYEEAFPNISFNFPVEIQNARDGTNRLFVLEQPGVIKVFPNSSNVGSEEVSTFLDIKSKVAYSSGQEIGLLGLAFHPQFNANGYVFVYYIDQPDMYRINIVRYTVSSSNPDTLDTSSELVIARYIKNQSDSNHNGGKIAFGPDGYLYISVGDGGGGGDPNRNAQNLNNVFGSILRIDIDLNGDNPLENNPELPNGNYEIPSDNPRVGLSGLDELYAWGIRNTWKFSFDGTGRLWGADVGQNNYEEINLITIGGNYGWNKFEANTEPSYGSSTSLATTPDLKPIFYYNRNAGDVSITGGYNYRGSLTNSILQNSYVYGDYVSGRIWALKYNDSGGTTTNQLLFKTNGQFISSFGEDENGELYFSDYRASAKIYKLTETVTGPITTPVDGVGEWASIGSGTNGTVETIVQDENGTRYVGGDFSTAGENSTTNIAMIGPNGEWQAFEGGTNGPVFSMALAPNGHLYAAGDFTSINGVACNHIAFYNGDTWAPLGSGTNGPISKIKFDANGALFVGGVFTTAGGLNVNNIAKWDTNTWSTLTDGATGITGTNNEIRSLAFDEDNHLYIGGNFDMAGGISANRIARWNGTNWSALGEGTSGFVQAIEAVGNYLYVGGNFVSAGDQTVNRIAQFNKTTGEWESLGNGLSGSVNAMESDGSFIYVGGSFETASDVIDVNKIVNNVARWSAGTGWQALGPNRTVGVNTRVNTLQLTNNNSSLLVGGNFSIAANLSLNNIAIWNNTNCSEVTTIPVDQFTITSRGYSCINSENGSIRIQSRFCGDFTATLTEISSSQTLTQNFRNELEITALLKGSYDLCITSEKFPDYENCSKIVITEPQPLTVETSLDGNTKLLTLNMKGSDLYTVSLNGKQIQSQNNTLSITLDKEVNTLKVSAAEGCNEIYEETIVLENSFLVYPNPVMEDLNVDLGSLTSDYVKISIYTSSGALLFSEFYSIESAVITIPVATLSKGIYFILLENEITNKSFTFIKS